MLIDTAMGRDCFRSGSRWGNGPPSLRPVRAVRAIARRWILRQRSRPYGVQQSRNLANERKLEPVKPSGVLTGPF